MIKQYKRKLLRTIKRQLRNNRLALSAGALVLCVAIVGYASYMNDRRTTVDPATYAPLLHLIARAESNNNYNAYYGNPANNTINFTAMPIEQVMAWQNSHVQQGNASSAVGRYQIVSPTLGELVQNLGIDVKQPFDEDTQDRLAIALLERRGSVAYVNNQLSRDEFAANLAKEWAALPRVIGENPTASYYAGDGLNASRVSVDEVMSAIKPIGPS